jgi:hypothetical protein
MIGPTDLFHPSPAPHKYRNEIWGSVKLEVFTPLKYYGACDGSYLLMFKDQATV